MKVILEIEYHANEWSIISLLKIFLRIGINVKLYNFGNQPNSNPKNKEPGKTYRSIPFIKKVVCMVTSMPENIFEMASRKQEVTENRQIAMFLCRKYTRKSLREIGVEFGNKTPATIMHACKTIQNLSQTDKKFQLKLAEIEKHLIAE